MTGKYILIGKSPVEVDDLIEWGLWIEKSDRKIAVTHVTRKIKVSTIFLGLDHQYGEGPPLLFETMIFGGPHDQYCNRYSTYDEAVAGHRKAVKLSTEKS